MPTKIELTGYEFSDIEKIFVKKSLFYKEPEPTKTYAHGEPATVNAAKTFISNYWDEIKGMPDAKSQNIAFTFGRETLLSILAQEECAGIKFYFGKRIESQRPVDFVGKWEGKTLVAIGVKNDAGETEIGANIDYLARGISDGTDAVKTNGDDTQPGMICEAVPPFTMDNIPKP